MEVIIAIIMPAIIIFGVGFVCGLKTKE